LRPTLEIERFIQSTDREMHQTYVEVGCGENISTRLTLGMFATQLLQNRGRAMVISERLVGFIGLAPDHAYQEVSVPQIMLEVGIVTPLLTLVLVVLQDFGQSGFARELHSRSTAKLSFAELDQLRQEPAGFAKILLGLLVIGLGKGALVLRLEGLGLGLDGVRFGASRLPGDPGKADHNGHNQGHAQEREHRPAPIPPPAPFDSTDRPGMDRLAALPTPEVIG